MEIHLRAEVTPGGRGRRGARRRRRGHRRRADRPADPGDRRRERARRPGASCAASSRVGAGERVAVDRRQRDRLRDRRARSPTGRGGHHPRDARKHRPRHRGDHPPAPDPRAKRSGVQILTERQGDHDRGRPRALRGRRRRDAGRRTPTSSRLALGWRPARQRARRAARRASRCSCSATRRAPRTSSPRSTRAPTQDSDYDHAAPGRPPRTRRSTHDPYPYFAELREADPVHWSERHQAWLVTRYDDVTAVLMDWKHLSSERVGRCCAPWTERSSPRRSP